MTDRFHVQWTPRDGPPQRVVFEPGAESQDETQDVNGNRGADRAGDGHEEWNRIIKQWDGRTWSRMHTESVEDPSVYAPAPHHDIETERTPPTLRELLEQTRQTWQGTDPQALVFELPAGPFVITVPSTYPRCYSGQQATTQPIAMDRLRALVRQVGLPSIVSLEQTPFSRTDFVRGEFNE